jgi:hypothetical protein
VPNPGLRTLLTLLLAPTTFTLATDLEPFEDDEDELAIIHVNYARGPSIKQEEGAQAHHRAQIGVSGIHRMVLWRGSSVVIPDFLLLWYSI